MPISESELKVLDTFRRLYPTATTLALRGRGRAGAGRGAGGSRRGPQPWGKRAPTAAATRPAHHDTDSGDRALAPAAPADLPGPSLAPVAGGGPSASGAFTNLASRPATAAGLADRASPTAHAEAGSLALAAARPVPGPGPSSSGSGSAPAARHLSRTHGGIQSRYYQEVSFMASALQTVEAGLRQLRPVAERFPDCAHLAEAKGLAMHEAIQLQTAILQEQYGTLRNAGEASPVLEEASTLALEVQQSAEFEATDHACAVAQSLAGAPWLLRQWWLLWHGEETAIGFLQAADEALGWMPAQRLRVERAAVAAAAEGSRPEEQEGDGGAGCSSQRVGMVLSRVAEHLLPAWMLLLAEAGRGPEWELVASRAVCGLVLVLITDPNSHYFNLEPLATAAMSTCYVLLQDFQDHSPGPVCPLNLYSALLMRLPLGQAPGDWQDLPPDQRAADMLAATDASRADAMAVVAAASGAQGSAAMLRALTAFGTMPWVVVAWVRFLGSWDEERLAREALHHEQQQEQHHEQQQQQQQQQAAVVLRNHLKRLAAILVLQARGDLGVRPPTLLQDHEWMLEPFVAWTTEPKLRRMLALAAREGAAAADAADATGSGASGNAASDSFAAPGPVAASAAVSAPGEARIAPRRARAWRLWRQLVQLGSLVSAAGLRPRSQELVDGFRLQLDTPEEVALALVCLGGCKRLRSEEPRTFLAFTPMTAEAAAAVETEGQEAAAGRAGQGVSLLVHARPDVVFANDPFYDWKEIRKANLYVTATTRFPDQYKVLRDALLKRKLHFAWQKGDGMGGAQRVVDGLTQLRMEMLQADRNIVVHVAEVRPRTSGPGTAGSRGAAKKAEKKPSVGSSASKPQAGAADTAPGGEGRFVGADADAIKDNWTLEWTGHIDRLLGRALMRDPRSGSSLTLEAPPEWALEDEEAVDAVERYLAAIVEDSHPGFVVEVAVAECGPGWPPKLVRPAAEGKAAERQLAERERQERLAAQKRERQALHSAMFAR